MRRVLVVVVAVAVLLLVLAPLGYARRFPRRRDGDPDEVQCNKRLTEPAAGPRPNTFLGQLIQKKPVRQGKHKRFRITIRVPGGRFFLEK